MTYESKIRPEIPKDKIIPVKERNKIDFNNFKFIYTEWWFDILVSVPFLISIILTIGYAVFYGLRIVGRKNLKIMRKQGCITISNHCHYFDTVFANLVVFPRALHTAVAQRNFEVPIVGQLLRMHRAFPIPAGGNGLDRIIEPVGRALKKKHHIHFLPEGDLVLLSQTIHRFRLGAFILSYKHQAPIIPIVYIIKRRSYRGKLMSPKWLKFTQVIGEPIFPPPLKDDGSVPKKDLEKMADRAASWMEDTIAEYHQEKSA